MVFLGTEWFILSSRAEEIVKFSSSRAEEIL